MKNCRLINLLRSLDSKELARLGDMVCSPYFNKDKKVVLLLETLKSFAPLYDAPELNRQWVFSQLFPDKKKVTASLSIKMTKLQRLIKEHLVWSNLEERPYYKRHLLLNSLLKKEQLDYFKSQYRETKSLLDNQKKIDVEAYHEIFLLEQDYRQFVHKQKGRNEHTPLTTVIQALDTYYLSRKLNLSSELVNLQGFVNLAFDPILFSNLDNVIAQPIYMENSFIQFYHAIFRILRDREDEDGFEHLLFLLQKPIAQGLGKKELNGVYTHAVNFCIDQIIKGKGEYRTKLFSLYLSLIENNLLYKGNYLDLGRFKNIVTLACQIGKLEFTKKLIHQLKNEIDPRYRESAYHYFTAVLFFYEKNYQAALDHLLDVKDDLDMFFVLNAKSHLLRCYYELNESQAFYYLHDTFSNHLRRNQKFNAALIKSYRNSTKLTLQLYRVKEGFSKKNVDSLVEEIEETKPLVDKNWLLEKYAELKKAARY